MALLSYDTDDKADERLNPASNELSARESATANQLKGDDNFDKDFYDPNDIDSAEKKVADQESSRNSNNEDGFYQPSNKPNKKQPMTFKSLMKKRGPIAMIFVLIAALFGIIGSLFGPATMLQNILENFTEQGDSASHAKQYRTRKVINRLFNSGDGTGICQTKGMRCKLGRISNKALRRLSEQGIKPVNADGSEIKLKNIQIKIPHITALRELMTVNQSKPPN